MNIHAYLRSLAEQKKIGESGLIALDWWNGNRSVIPNDKLSGMILGLRLDTRPEDIYRALIESTVFELRRVYENYTRSGVDIKSFIATGGIAAKDPMLMQILADTLGREVECLTESNATSLGAAVFGATAAGIYGSLEEATDKMKIPASKTYVPIRENVEAYDKLYSRYVELYDYFAAGGNDVMNFLYDYKNTTTIKEKTK
jgi:L-ribulokinase